MRDVYGNEIQTQAANIPTPFEMRMFVEGGESLRGVLIQDLGLQYVQPSEIVREIGSEDFYQHGKPPSGSLSISRLVADKKSNLLDIFPSGKNGGPNMFDVSCNGRQPSIKILPLETDCGDFTSVGYILRDCIIVDIGVSVNASSQFLQERIVIQFGVLEFADANS